MLNVLYLFNIIHSKTYKSGRFLWDWNLIREGINKLIGFLLLHFELIFTICQRYDDKEVSTTELEANQL